MRTLKDLFQLRGSRLALSGLVTMLLLNSLGGAAIAHEAQLESDQVYFTLSRSAMLLPEPGGVTLLPSSTYDWLQFGGSPQHTSNNTQETIIGPSNVGLLTPLFQVKLTSPADNSPVYLAGVTIAGVVHDVLFLTTTDGSIAARDAHTGTQLWLHPYPAVGRCFTVAGKPCFTTASPAIDPNRQFVYSYGLDGLAHKLGVSDGTEVTSGGWPEIVTLKPDFEKGSSSLTVATSGGISYLYVVTASFADKNDYQGHVTTINLTDGSQHVFNTLCSDQTTHFVRPPGSPDCAQTHAGIWGRSGVFYDTITDRIFFATGNGLWNPGTHMWGDSDLSLKSDGTGAAGGPIDSYTPSNQLQFVKGDHDLGSSSPVPIGVPSNSLYQHVAVQASKYGNLRLINLDNLSGTGGPGQLGGEIAIVPMPGSPAGFAQEVISEPASWVNPSDGSDWVFVSNKNGLAALRVIAGSNNVPTLNPVWHHTASSFPDGNSPLVANGVLYIANPHAIQAFDPTTGNLLWQDTHIGGVHWSSPIVVNGVLYVTDKAGQLSAYKPK